jgi:hypothetical protein
VKDDDADANATLATLRKTLQAMRDDNDKVRICVRAQYICCLFVCLFVCLVESRW